MTTGFTFGAKTTATPTFGTGSITFGTPAAQPPQQQFSFGNLSTSAPNLFGTTSTASLGLKQSGFGTTATTASSGFSLSTPAPGFSFSTSTPGFAAPASTAASSGLAFGTPASSTALTFGTSAATSSLGFKPAASTALTFGTPASSTGLTFGATTSTPSTGLTFGAVSSAPATGLTFGATPSAPSLGLNFGTSTAAPTLSFGTPATTSSLSFGGTTTTAGLGFGTSTSSFSGFGLGSLATSTTTATTTQPSVGLGGIATTQYKAGGAATTQKEMPPKEQPLPNEFMQLVDQFKNVVQEEKNRSSEVARCSVREYHKVETELDSLNQQISHIENQVMANRFNAEQLKYDTAKGLQSMEMAQRTQETPPSLQYDNNVPLQFFLDLADNFEREMQMLKIKIDNTEKFIKKCNEPSVLTSQDLALGLKRLHETFVALAGRMQSVHTQVETQKEVFLTLRRQGVKDNNNPFEKINKTSESMNLIMRNALKSAPPNLASGPTPFNSMAVGSNNLALATQQTPPPPYPAVTAAPLGFGLSNNSLFGAPTTTTSMFQPSTFGTPFQFNTSSNFQLQKPPSGTKRGKP